MATTQTKKDIDKLMEGFDTNPDNMIESSGGWRFGGRVVSVTKQDEADSKYEPQILIMHETEHTKTGEMPIWFAFGKSWAKSGVVDAKSKGGLLLKRFETLGHKGIKWSALLGMFIVWEKENHDMGGVGVQTLMLPIYMGKDEVDRDEPVSLHVLKSEGEDEDESAPDVEPDNDDPTYEASEVTVALALMDGKTLTQAKKAIAKADELDDSNIPDAFLEGDFQKYLLDKEYIAEIVEGTDTFSVIDTPDEE